VQREALGRAALTKDPTVEAVFEDLYGNNYALVERKAMG
jgi:hypothetical protein